MGNRRRNLCEWGHVIYLIDLIYVDQLDNICESSNCVRRRQLLLPRF
jgi:hypothetical protein